VTRTRLESELPDEIFGALRLKRKVGGTGYMYVTGPKRFSKKNPYHVPGARQEQAKCERGRRRTWACAHQHQSPHAAAIAVATVLGGGDNEQMESPRKHRTRGVQCSAPGLAFERSYRNPGLRGGVDTLGEVFTHTYPDKSRQIQTCPHGYPDI
jgi:hypothetical protein